MFAALWEAYRVEYQMSSGGPGSGLFKSTDGGDTWTEITRNPGLPPGVVGKIGVAVSGADSNRVYALVENENGGLFSSDDAGATWKLVNDGRNIRQRAFYYTHVSADPNNKDTVYVLNIGAFRSTDGGKTLTQHRQRHARRPSRPLDRSGRLAITSCTATTAAARSPTTSRRTQRTWTAQDFPTAQFYHVITTAHVPYHVCGAQQDSSTLCVPSNTDLGGGGGGGGGGGRGGAPRPTAAGGGEPGYIAPDPKDPDVFFAGANNGSFLTRLNRRTGELREVEPVSAHVLRRAVERARRALAVDVSDHLLAGRSERALHLVAARVEDDQRRPDAGTGSAAISRVTIRRRWGRRAARSRTT